MASRSSSTIPPCRPRRAAGVACCRQPPRGTCLASAGLRSSVCFDVTQELIHETPRIRKRHEMATCKLVDGHVQSFLRDAPLGVDWKKSVVAGGDDVGRNLGPRVESTGLAEDDVGLGPLVRVSLLEDLGRNVVPEIRGDVEVRAIPAMVCSRRPRCNRSRAVAPLASRFAGDRNHCIDEHLHAYANTCAYEGRCKTSKRLHDEYDVARPDRFDDPIGVCR